MNAFMHGLGIGFGQSINAMLCGMVMGSFMPCGFPYMGMPIFGPPMGGCCHHARFCWFA